MAMSEDAPLLKRIPAHELGGPAPADPTVCSETVIALMSTVAGEGMRMTSLNLDVTAAVLGETDVSISARVDKRARSIVFVSAEARSDAQLIFTAQGLFVRSA